MVIIKINSIKIIENLYPRVKCNWQTEYRYSEEMKSGAKFPPIDVALLKNKYVLIDGRHRIEAYKLLKEPHIQANIHKGLNEKQIFELAIKLNVAHGQNLSFQDKTMLMIKLKDLNYDLATISSLINVPMDKIEGFIATRITNTLGGSLTYLKKPLHNMAGIDISEELNNDQNSFTSITQFNLIDNLISLIKDEAINLDDNKIVNKLKELKNLINKLL